MDDEVGHEHAQRLGGGQAQAAVASPQVPLEGLHQAEAVKEMVDDGERSELVGAQSQAIGVDHHGHHPPRV